MEGSCIAMIDKPAFDGPLWEADWNFSRVPDDQIIACCLWEYARESASINLAAASHAMESRHILPEGSRPPTEKQIERWAEIDERTRDQVKRARFNHDRFLERFWDSEVGHLTFYGILNRWVTSGSGAFQDLPGKVRRMLAEKVSQADTIGALTLANLGDVERLWIANSKDLREIRAWKRPANDDAEDVALTLETEPVEGSFFDHAVIDRTRTVAFTVDFSRFSDAEIESSFHAWVRKNRPRRWRKPATVLLTSRRRGVKRNDYRVALERLGMMRLLHWFTPSQLRAEVPAAWKLYGRKEPVFRREVRAAVRFFHDRFPFLPRTEQPECAERLMKWWRPLDKELTEWEGQQGIK